jgi:two-component system sensor histidine kinase DegS
MLKPEDFGSTASAQFPQTQRKVLFYARAHAVFYTRVALMILYLSLLSVPAWQDIIPANPKYTLPVFFFVLIYTIASYVLAEHRRYGRQIMFWTMNCDLLVLLSLVSQTGGLSSPIMSAQLLNTTFFALLFPSPIGVVAPMLMLPAATWVTLQSAQVPPLGELSLLLVWHALLNGLAIYIAIYLSSREEAQRQAILHLESELAALVRVEERNRLSRDIHDGLGGTLSGLIIQAEYLLTLTQDDDPLRNEIVELKSSGEEAIDEVRRALSMMRNEFELVPQLENACQTFTSRSRLPVNLEINGVPPQLTEEQQLSIFRILQESLTNIMKHAQAQKVDVEVIFAPSGLVMRIKDDGKGFAPDRKLKMHYGLQNMRERARKIQGVVDIQSHLHKGTTISLQVSVNV